jgi:(p)ppGpp synthase/HD superfamily hydrolase
VASLEIFEEQLGDFSFKYIYPEEYERLSLRVLELYNKEVITDAMKNLESVFQERMVVFHSIYGREKSLYSIYKKMLRYYSDYDTHGIEK